MKSATDQRQGQAAPGVIKGARRVVSGDAGWHARVLARRLAEFLDSRLAETGLNSAQFTLMCLVAASRDDTIAALADAARLDPSTLSRNLAVLQRAGWVEVVTAEADRRRRAVWLTEAGLRVLARAMPLWRAAHEELAGHLGTAAVAGLAEAAARI